MNNINNNKCRLFRIIAKIEKLKLKIKKIKQKMQLKRKLRQKYEQIIISQKNFENLIKNKYKLTKI